MSDLITIKILAVFKLTSFLSLILLVSGCENYSKDDHILNTTLASLKRDTFYIDVPKNTRGGIGPEFASARRLENTFHLPKIAGGFDSLYVRIWLATQHELTELITIKNNHHDWEATFTTISSVKTTNPEAPWETKVFEEKKSPGDGWGSFLKGLSELDLFTLPTDDSIKNYDNAVYYKQVMVEISTKSFYRLYIYTDPLHNSSKIKEAAQVEKIIAFLQDELGIKLKTRV